MLYFLYWAPRILAIIYILFISLFALDIFSENYSLIRQFFALLIHLIPSVILLIITIVAWKKPQIGGILFIALALGYILMAWDRFPFMTYVIITGPLFLIGILFLIPSSDESEKKTIEVKT
ncbi:MAG: DUF7670 domain-containing protein [Patescibacteria group bacterium]